MWPRRTRCSTRDRLNGLKKNGDGFRLRTDNGDVLRLQVIAIAAFLPYPKLSEMVADQWRKIGIQADVHEMERGLGFAKETNNEHQLFVWNNGGTELLYLFPTWAVPVIPGARGRSLTARRGTSRPAASRATAGRPEYPEDFRSLFRGFQPGSADGRNKNAQEIWKIIVDQQYAVSARLASRSPASACGWYRTNPWQRSFARVRNAQHCRTPGNSHPETWYFKAMRQAAIKAIG